MDYKVAFYENEYGKPLHITSSSSSHLNRERKSKAC